MWFSLLHFPIPFLAFTSARPSSVLGGTSRWKLAAAKPRKRERLKVAENVCSWKGWGYKLKHYQKPCMISALTLHHMYKLREERGGDTWTTKTTLQNGNKIQGLLKPRGKQMVTSCLHCPRSLDYIATPSLLIELINWGRIFFWDKLPISFL